jgi:hypothetical protein
MSKSDRPIGERVSSLEADNINIKELLIDIKKAITEGFDKWSRELKLDYKNDIDLLHAKLVTTEENLKKVIDAHSQQLEELFIIRVIARYPKLFILCMGGFLVSYIIKFISVQEILNAIVK